MEESTAEETKLCNNCQREVSAANFLMHVHHCEKYMQCCPMCKEPVNRNNMQEHIDENHRLVYCKQCHKQMECSQLDDHLEDECPMRMVDCEYCELQVKAMDHYQHQDHCGSRTDVCDKCQQYVMLKEMKNHLENMCAAVVPDDRRSHPIHVEEPNFNGGEAAGYEGVAARYGGEATGFAGTAGYGGGAMESAGLDQSWVNAIAACNEDGRSLSSILAENLAGNDRQWPPVNNSTFGSDNDFTHEFQHKKEHPFTDSAENQQKQFDLLHQMQSDAEMAQRLQEQYNAENEPPETMTHDNDMVPNDEPHLSPHHIPHITPEVHNIPSHTLPNDMDDMIHNGEAHMIPAGVQDENTAFGLPHSMAALQLDRPNHLMPEEELIPCEWCGKGIPPQYLQSHQLQTCPQLSSNDRFHPQESVDSPVQATDNHDITPTVEGTYHIFKCEHCGARVPAEQYDKHLELCDAATGPCEYCNKSIPINKLFEHQVTCQHNAQLFRPAMKFPQSPWPNSKGKDKQRKPHYLASENAVSAVPDAMPIFQQSLLWNNSNSHDNSSYHSNSDSSSSYNSSFESRYPAVIPVDEEDMSNDMSTVISPQRHDIGQLIRPPLHKYSPASVLVKETGNKVTHPPE